MGELLVVGTDLRVASNVTFIPGATPDKNKAIVTVMNNMGKTKSGRELRSEVTCNFWGKYASVAAYYLYPGKQVNIRGTITSYTTETGQITASGKHILNRKVEVKVDNLQLLGDSLKEINRRIQVNSGTLKADGRMQQHEIFSAEELLKNTENLSISDYNPALAAQTGMYGKAKVWDKATGGFIIPNSVPMAAPAVSNDQAQIRAELDQMKAAYESLLASQAQKTETPVMESAATAEMAVEEEEVDLFPDAE